MKRYIPVLTLGVLLLATHAVMAQPPVQVSCDDQALPSLPEFSRMTGIANAGQAYDARYDLMVNVHRMCQRGFGAVLWDREVATRRPIRKGERIAFEDTAR